MAIRGSKLRPGVYVPVVTPFKPDGTEEIDLPVFKINITRLAKAGCGLVLMGTLGEGNLLDKEERLTLIRTAKEVLVEEGLADTVPIIAGINGDSLRQCKIYAKDAAEAGADAV